MSEALSEIGKKGLALAILLVAAYVLFKVVIGVVTAVAWIVVVVLAIAAAIWAFATLSR
jgi:putative Ca2+/H+ antiporter (TMEM165/GDT1 family)